MEYEEEYKYKEEYETMLRVSAAAILEHCECLRAMPVNAELTAAVLRAQDAARQLYARASAGSWHDAHRAVDALVVALSAAGQASAHTRPVYRDAVCDVLHAAITAGHRIGRFLGHHAQPTPGMVVVSRRLTPAPRPNARAVTADAAMLIRDTSSSSCS